MPALRWGSGSSRTGADTIFGVYCDRVVFVREIVAMRSGIVARTTLSKERPSRNLGWVVSSSEIARAVLSKKENYREVVERMRNAVMVMYCTCSTRSGPEAPTTPAWFYLIVCAEPNLRLTHTIRYL